jgi:proline iminopeptidase
MIDYFRIAEPFESGMLDVGDGQHLYFEVRGNPNGKPAVVLHGGPGQGSHPAMTRGFDPQLYKIILFDQRGCGRSLPHASAPDTKMDLNTTWHLIRDMETLRDHLKVDRWLICGASWGSALALAYAIKFPERVTELVLMAIFTAQAKEYQWLYHDLGATLPKDFDAFRSLAFKTASSKDVFYSYSQLLGSDDRSTQLAAARAWCDWEDAVLANEPNAKRSYPTTDTSDEMIAFARICAHYALHDAWLTENGIIAHRHRISEIPAVIIHGRQDRGCPAEIVERLSDGWNKASLTVLEDSGHLASPSKKLKLLQALREFAQTGR